MDIATKCQTHKAQRLIDVNALKEAWKDVAVDGATLSYIYGLFKSVDDAPTIDAVPKHQLYEETSTLDTCPYYHHEPTGEPFCEMEDRRHGTWKDIYGDSTYWRCSVCGEVFCCNDNYCPNCGAKMRGGENE